MSVAKLSHANILAIHEFGRDAGTAFVVTELVDGETLRARLAHGALPARRAVGTPCRSPAASPRPTPAASPIAISSPRT